MFARMQVFDISGFNAKLVEVSLRILESKFNGPIPRGVLERYYRRALRTGVYWRLPEETRGLLYVALRSTVTVFRGSRVVRVLRRALAYVDLLSLRGYVVLLGLSHALARGFVRLEDALSKAGYIAYVGRWLLESLNYFYPHLRISGLRGY